MGEQRKRSESEEGFRHSDRQVLRCFGQRFHSGVQLDNVESQTDYVEKVFRPQSQPREQSSFHGYGKHINLKLKKCVTGGYVCCKILF